MRLLTLATLILVCVYAVGSLRSGEATVGTPAAAPVAETDAGGAAGANTATRAVDPAAMASQGGSFFQYTDDSGSVHFVQTRAEIPAKYREAAGQIEVSKSISRVDTVRRGARAYVPQAKPKRPEVTVYTTKWCGWCRKTLAWLDRQGIRYTNKDIESNPRFRDELIRKSGGAAIPYVEIGGQGIHGYSTQRMAAALARG